MNSAAQRQGDDPNSFGGAVAEQRTDFRKEDPMPYWRLHYHLNWATYNRYPLLTEPIERQVFGTLRNKAHILGIIVHAIGGIQDHIHLVVSIPPKLAVADCLEHFKGASSRYANLQPEASGSFRWQEGYGALSFGDGAMSDIISYVLNQKRHHGQGSLRPHLERYTTDEEGVEIPFG